MMLLEERNMINNQCGPIRSNNDDVIVDQSEVRMTYY